MIITNAQVSRRLNTLPGGFYLTTDAGDRCRYIRARVRKGTLQILLLSRDAWVDAMCGNVSCTGGRHVLKIKIGGGEI